MSKISRRTVDTGTSLVADGMGAKTLHRFGQKQEGILPELRCSDSVVYVYQLCHVPDRVKPSFVIFDFGAL